MHLINLPTDVHTNKLHGTIIYIISLYANVSEIMLISIQLISTHNAAICKHTSTYMQPYAKWEGKTGLSRPRMGGTASFLIKLIIIIIIFVFQISGCQTAP